MARRYAPCLWLHRIGQESVQDDVRDWYASSNAFEETTQQDKFQIARGIRLACDKVYETMSKLYEKANWSGIGSHIMKKDNMDSAVVTNPTDSSLNLSIRFTNQAYGNIKTSPVSLHHFISSG